MREYKTPENVLDKVTSNITEDTEGDHFRNEHMEDAAGNPTRKLEWSRIEPINAANRHYNL